MTLNVAVIAGGVAMISAAGRRLLRCRQADLLSAVLIGVRLELNWPKGHWIKSISELQQNKTMPPGIGTRRHRPVRSAFPVIAFLLFVFFFLVFLFVIRFFDFGEFQHG